MTRRLGILSRIAVCAAALALGATASATVARYLEIGEHVESSDLVIRAKTGAALPSFVGADGRPRTEVPFTVLQVYKGAVQPGATVKVRQIRGEADGAFVSVPGDAIFQEGEEVVLFLVTDPDGTAFLTAMGQSKFNVRPGPDGSFVDRDLGGIAFYVGGAGAKIVPGDGEAPVPLSIFSKELLQAAGAGRSTK